MAIRLKIQDNTVKLRVGEGPATRLKVADSSGPRPREYDGPTSVTPSEEEQTLATEGLMVAQNITVGPIPSNYGRIAYNGSVITVY